MAKFKMENAGRLPDQLQSNLQAVNTLELQQQSVNESINRDAQDKMMLETPASESASRNPRSSAPTWSRRPAARQVKNERLIQLNNKILDFETQLSAARQTYKEDHPDIRSLEAQLGVLKKQRDDLEKEESSAAAKAGAPKKVTNPQVAQSLENLKLQMANVKAQIQARNMEMEERTKQLKELQAEIAAYRARIEAIPVNEQRYAELQRDYNLAKADYDDKAKKKEISETSSNLEERKAGENLETLDPARLPEQASEPNRLLIAGAGIGPGAVLRRIHGGRQGDEGHLPEEPERRPRLHQPAGAEQHSAAGECPAGAPQTPAVLAGLVHRHHHRHHRHEQFDVLLLFREELGSKMSRVHDALRRAEQAGVLNLENGNAPAAEPD